MNKKIKYYRKYIKGYKAYMDYSGMLYWWRDRMNMTQAQAAEALGMSLRTYARYENGHTAIPLPMLMVIGELPRPVRRTVEDNSIGDNSIGDTDAQGNL